MTLIADIAHDITANPAPVLFLDTCILLDIVRAPLRGKPDEVRFAQLFLTSVQKNPKTIHLLVPSPVQPEWDTHIQERANECADSRERLQRRGSNMRSPGSSRGCSSSGRRP